MSLPIIALLNADDESLRLFESCNFNSAVLKRFTSVIDLCAEWSIHELPIVAIISQGEIMGSYGIYILDFLEKKGLQRIPFFIITKFANENMKSIALNAGVTDVFVYPLVSKSLEIRINFCNICT
jgi:response regulator RpfG family c-di-GMP phosphodiesterase